MVSVFAALTTLALLAPAQVPDSSVRRSTLANGVVIWCETRESPTVSVQLFLSNRTWIDSSGDYGHRHLLEHVVARSIPNLDHELEKSGGYMTASTTRDWIKFEWRVPPDQLSLALTSMQRFVSSPVISQEAIDREINAIALELELQTPVDHLSADAWTAIYGDFGKDALGDATKLKGLTPIELRKTWKRVTEPNNVVITAAGPLEKDRFIIKMREVFGGLPIAKRASAFRRKPEANFVTSNAVAIPTVSIAERPIGARLVYAFGIADLFSQPAITFNPTSKGGVILVSSLDANFAVAKALKGANLGFVYDRGLQNARSWIASKQRYASSSSEFAGQLLTTDPNFTPQKLSDFIEQVTESELAMIHRQTMESIR